MFFVAGSTFFKERSVGILLSSVEFCVVFQI
jgi:hypothetical protein